MWILSCVLIPGIASSAQVRSEPKTTILSSCATFALNGDSAFAAVETNGIFLEITGSGGTVSHLNLPLRYPAPAQPANLTISRNNWTCAVYFNHQSDVVALAVGSQFGKHEVAHLQVGVAELKTATWIGNFGVEPQLDFVPLSLAGFLEDTNSLVISGTIKNRRGAEQDDLPATVVLSPLGEPVSSSTPTARKPTEATDAFRSYADALHNRLWLFACSDTRVKPYHVPFCPVSVTSLVGEDLYSATLEPGSYSGKRDTLWMWPRAFAAPDSNSILIAETVSGKDMVWRVDMQKRSIDRFELPHNHFVKYNGLRDIALSPDGEVLAVLLNQIELGFPYFVDNYVFRGTDVAVIQARPFRLLGMIPHRDSSYTAALAVDHREGKATVLVYRQGHQERQEFSAPH
jgi:hypothetical protein